VLAGTDLPPRGAWLERRAADGAVLGRTELDGNGRIQLVGPAPAAGVWRLHAAGCAAAAIDLAATSESELVVELAPEARLELRLDASDAAMLAHARVVLLTSDGARHLSAAAPTATFAELPAGPLELRVESDDSLAAWSGALAAGQTFALRLSIAPRGTLACRVVDASGAPLPRRCVVFTRAGGEAPLLFETGEDGCLRRSVPAGSATVRCGGTSTFVEIAAGRTVEVTLRGE
jgi:hypothetical protein